MNPDPNFHLYLLLGQSNMAGRGQVTPQDQEIHPRVFALNKAGAWAPAADPMHFDKPIAGVGPGLTFGKTMAEQNPSIRVGLIPCAAGGSPISSWRPGGYWGQTDSHPYDDALARARIALQDGVLKGLLWHQGESDRDEQDVPEYQERLAVLVARLRTDLDSPHLPFVVATLGDFVVADHPGGQIVNQALQRLPERVANSACVSAQGLDHKGDAMHFDTASARELGRRYAAAMRRLQAAMGRLQGA